MNNEKIEVSRELLERVETRLDLRAEFCVTYPPETKPMNDDAILLLELRALLATQVAQHQGEPVAWMNTATGYVTTSPVVVMDWDDEKDPVQSLYRNPADHLHDATKMVEQPEPVAWQKLAKDAAFFLSSALEANAQHMTPESLHAALEVCSKIRAEQSAPVAVVLPERRQQDGWQSLTSQDIGWNSAIDEVARLNTK